MKKKTSIGLGGISTSVLGQPVHANPLTGQVGTTVPIANSGDVHANVGLGVGPTGDVGVSPRVQIGNSPGAATGAGIGGTAASLGGDLIGGPIGGAVGSTVGSAAGSLIGGAFGGGINPDHAARNSIRGNITNGFGGDTFQLPDGSTANFSLDAHDGLHDFKDPTLRNDNQGDRKLFAYDTDYTNNLDYLAGMGGTNLSRLINGNKSKSVDQLGGLMGNQALGSVGYGKDMTPQNFQTVVGNLRAMYAKQGIQNKQEMLSLANKAFADGRINDADHATMQQTANIIFDGDYNLASQLMANRNAGIKTAATPPGKPTGPVQQTPQNQPGRIYSPIISPSEAQMSVQPYIDQYNAARKAGYNAKINHGLQTGASIAQGVALATGLYSIGNKLTDNGLGNWIKGLAQSGVSGANYLYNDITGSPHNEGIFSGINDITNLDTSANSTDLSSAADSGASFFDSLSSGF